LLDRIPQSVPLGYYINSDEIEKLIISGTGINLKAYGVSPEINDLKRAVMSGYHVYLYFISTDDVRVNIARVKTRVKNGGHDVPEDKIRNRYIRSLELLYDALKICYKSYLFDNSHNTMEIAKIDRDKMMYISVAKEKIPNWMIKYVISKSDGSPA
jgi:predicted ABC-type ATPase